MARFCQCRKGLYNECVPYRIPTPPEPEPPGEEEAYLVELARRQRRSRFVGIAGAVGVVAVLGTCALRPTRAEGPPRPTPAERFESADRAVNQARDRAWEAQATFEREMKRAIATPFDESTLPATCPMALPPATPFGRRSVPLLVIDEDAKALPSQSVAELLADIKRASVHLTTGSFEEATLYARALASPDRLRPEIVVVTHTFTKPRTSGQTTYEPGRLEGRAFLYDFSKQRVVCAGPLSVKSSKEIGFTYSPALDAPVGVSREGSLAYALDDDMQLQIAKTAREALHVKTLIY